MSCPRPVIIARNWCITTETRVGFFRAIFSCRDAFPWQSTYHPDEGALQLMQADVLALPAALQTFNGFYTESGNFVIENPVRNLIAAAIAGLLILVLLGTLLFRYLRRRSRARTPAHA
jgi:hypothetical protein